MPAPEIVVEEFRSPDRTTVKTFCLRSIASGQQDVGGYDKYMSFIEASFVAGKAVVDLSRIIRSGARFSYIVLGNTRTHVGASATVDGKTLTEGQAVLDTEAFTDATTGITNVSILSQTTKTGNATVMLFYNPGDAA